MGFKPVETASHSNLYSQKCRDIDGVHNPVIFLIHVKKLIVCCQSD
jgi:hypothetical protein